MAQIRDFLVKTWWKKLFFDLIVAKVVRRGDFQAYLGPFSNITTVVRFCSSFLKFWSIVSDSRWVPNLPFFNLWSNKWLCRLFQSPLLEIFSVISNSSYVTTQTDIIDGPRIRDQKNDAITLCGKKKPITDFITAR